MANLPIVDGKFKLVQNISASGKTTTTLDTDNTFVDKKIVVETNTPAGALGAGSGSVTGSSDVSGLLGTASGSAPSSGHYVKVEGTATVGVATEGYLETSASQSVNIDDKYYPITEAQQTISGGALTAGSGSTALASDGLSNGSGSVDATKKIALTTTDANGYYELEASGSGTVNRGAVTKQVTQDGYIPSDSSPVTAISADSKASNTATQKYYVKQQVVTGNTSIVPATTQQTVTFSDGYSHETTTVIVAPMGAGTIAMVLDDTGLSTYFNAESSSASADVTLIPKYTNTAGYFDAHSTATTAGGTEYYSIKEQTITETATTVSGSTATRGSRTESVGWNDSAETLPTTTFANSGTSGASYVDISLTTSAPTLVSGDYLYINRGWTDNLKISLAKLVPDGSNITGHADKIVTGYTAYDNDGSLITGSLPVYAGSYTVA